MRMHHVYNILNKQEVSILETIKDLTALVQTR